MKARHKDIYICSTVRHLLFSLYKAQENKKQAVIVFFYDFQNIYPLQIDTTQTPKNINLILVNRKSLVKHIKKSGLIGRFILFCSLRGLSISKSTQCNLVDLFKTYDDNLDFDFTINTLFLFNDNNKMSRLFRLLSKSYSMLEDGMGNYIEHKIESKPKQVLRYIQGKQPKYYVFGEKDQCKEVYAIHPNNLPKSIMHKGKRLMLSKDKAIVDSIKTCFRFKEEPSFSDNGLIIATQPVFTEIKDKLISDNFFLDIYKIIILLSREKGLTPILKLHPLEQRSDYLSIENEGAIFLSNKLPLELYLLSSTEKTNIITINSSVGIGMEEYCNVYNLIPDDKVSNYMEVLSDYEKNRESLQEIISIQLSKIKQLSTQ
ncbi:hypothetical protein [Vibrio cyclitrophicus]|uniref:hypothetical protein n=1 Tax=Vibrio cyclitrophicus TaxID=47951 RepID=UPI0038AF4AE5